MQYLGGKSSIAKHLVAFMRPYILERGAYVEPFVGAANVIAAVQDCPVRIGGDVNAALVTLWKAAAGGWQPPTTVSEEDYKRIKGIQDPTDPVTAFVGFGCSFAGRWFEGYARNTKGKNYAAVSARSVIKKAANLGDVIWHTGGYETCPAPTKSVIYCDPPYANTKKYSGTPSFRSDAFWEWCLTKQKEGHLVFISEYTAPPAFRVVFEMPTKTRLRTNAAGCEPRTERLFTPLEV